MSVKTAEIESVVEQLKQQPEVDVACSKTLHIQQHLMVYSRSHALVTVFLWCVAAQGGVCH